MFDDFKYEFKFDFEPKGGSEFALNVSNSIAFLKEHFDISNLIKTPEEKINHNFYVNDYFAFEPKPRIDELFSDDFVFNQDLIDAVFSFEKFEFTAINTPDKIMESIDNRRKMLNILTKEEGLICLINELKSNLDNSKVYDQLISLRMDLMNYYSVIDDFVNEKTQIVQLSKDIIKRAKVNGYYQFYDYATFGLILNRLSEYSENKDVKLDLLKRSKDQFDAYYVLSNELDSPTLSFYSVICMNLFLESKDNADIKDLELAIKLQEKVTNNTKNPHEYVELANLYYFYSDYKYHPTSKIHILSKSIKNFRIANEFYNNNEIKKSIVSINNLIKIFKSNNGRNQNNIYLKNDYKSYNKPNLKQRLYHRRISPHK